MNQPDQKKTVLLVDDAPANIQVVNSILKDIYKIRIATNGAKALELAKATPPPDLVLLDVMMPEMDGYEVCSRLKVDPETRDIPVIFLTGQTEIEEETEDSKSVRWITSISRSLPPSSRRACKLISCSAASGNNSRCNCSGDSEGAGNCAANPVVNSSSRDPEARGSGHCCALHPHDFGRRRFLRLHRRR